MADDIIIEIAASLVKIWLVFLPLLFILDFLVDLIMPD